MSIVPYDNANRIVYHDPHNRILVVHNNRHNTVELHNSARLEHRDSGFSDFGREFGERDWRTEHCPNCGIDLSEFLRRSSSESSEERKPRDRYDRFDRFDRFQDRFQLDATEFMHQDYFRLLADLPFSEPALEAPNRPSSLPGELFNQGYFQRFFRKIPPEILGSGAHAQVYKVVHVLKNIQLGVFAVKRINVGDHSQYLNQVLNEVLILYELSVTGANENNLIRYNHVWMEYGPANDSGTFILGQSGDTQLPYVYILQQYCDGGHLEHLVSSLFPRNESLQSKVEHERLRRRSKKEPKRRKWLWDVEIWKFFSDIANGVDYLHSHGILHRDLKPSNCLLESKYTEITEPQDFEDTVKSLPKVLVSDFGEGKFIDKSAVSGDERRGNTGTIEFTDPKLWVYSHFETRTFAYNFTYDCDIYSLGMILCYLCVGTLPFESFISDPLDPEAVRSEIADWHASLTPENFHEWFEATTLALKGTMTQAQREFEVLIYMMVKGPEKPTAKAVKEYLASMKWSFESGEGTKATEVKMNDSEMKELDDLDVGDSAEVIDLTKISADTRPDVRPKSVRLRSVRSNLVPVQTWPALGYFVNLVILEAGPAQTASSALKAIHLLGLVKALAWPQRHELWAMLCASVLTIYMLSPVENGFWRKVW